MSNKLAELMTVTCAKTHSTRLHRCGKLMTTCVNVAQNKKLTRELKKIR